MKTYSAKLKCIAGAPGTVLPLAVRTAVRSVACLCTCLFITQESYALSACNSLLRECFAYQAAERANCFYVASRHSFCEEQSEGTLALKRWQMAPVQHPGLEDAAALLGPKIVNTECLRNFDAQLSATLMEENPNERQLAHLNALLTSCERILADDIVRP